MTKVNKGEFEKLESVKISDVSLTYNTSLEIFNDEFNRMSRMEDDLFTYEVEIIKVTNIPYDEVELTNEESSDFDGEDEVAEIFRIETNVFDFETPLCKAFKEFNYLLQIDPDVLTKNIEEFKTYDDYKDDWIYEWNKDFPWVHKKPWTDIGVWTEPTPVKHCCKSFNYKNGCLEWPSCSWRDDGYCNGGNFPRAYIVGNTLCYQDLEWYDALKDSELKEEARCMYVNLFRYFMMTEVVKIVECGLLTTINQVFAMVIKKSTKKASRECLDNGPRPCDYSFDEWLKVKIGHTNIYDSDWETVFNDRDIVFNEWILDSFDVEEEYAKEIGNSYSRRFDEYK
ncbi:hypothetical protein Tco_0732124 [Tanacetum coccineum]